MESYYGAITSIKKKRNKSKRVGLWESDSGIRVGKLTILVRSFEYRKNITEFKKSISSTRIGKLLVILDVKGTKDKHISRWVDQGILIYVGWKGIENSA